MTAQVRPANWRTRVHGIALAFGLGMVAIATAKALSSWLSGSGHTVVSPVFCAVVIGVLWRHGLGTSPHTQHGVEWIVQTLLRMGIALVGLQLTLQGAGAIAGLALPVIVLCIVGAFSVSVLAARWLNIRRPLQSLLAVGAAVCGCTAVVAIAPLVRARAEEIGAAVACVVLIGSVGMLAYPWLAHHLFAASPRAAAVFLGTSIHDTSQVIGASLIYEQHFGVPGMTAMAGATKLLRNLSLLILVPLLARQAARDESAGGEFESGSSRRLRRADVLPGFIIGFLCFALLRFAGDTWIAAGTFAHPAWQYFIELGALLSSVLLVWGMCAVGLSISVRSIGAIGWRVLLAAVLIAATTVSVSMVSVALLDSG